MTDGKGEDAGLDGSVLWVWTAGTLCLGITSCLDNIDSSDDFVEPAVAQDAPGTVREPLGVELFGKGGTA